MHGIESSQDLMRKPTAIVLEARWMTAEENVYASKKKKSAILERMWS